MRVEAVPAPAAAPERLRDAARQFESLMLGQLLKAMQPEEGDAVSGMAQEQLAQALAASGGLGFAKMLEKAFAGVGARVSGVGSGAPVAPSTALPGSNTSDSASRER